MILVWVVQDMKKSNCVVCPLDGSFPWANVGVVVTIDLALGWEGKRIVTARSSLDSSSRTRGRSSRLARWSLRWVRCCQESGVDGNRRRTLAVEGVLVEDDCADFHS